MASWDASKFAQEAAQVVGPLAREGKGRQQTCSRPDLITRLDEYFEQLARVTMTAKFNTDARVRSALGTVVKPEHFFDQAHVDKAQQLLHRFDNDNWGAPPNPMDDDGATRATSPGSPRPRRVSSGGSRRRRASSPRTGLEQPAPGYGIGRPPASHPIWGVQGIMHGITYKRSGKGKRSNILNPQYRTQKRNSKIHGHNNIRVGQWFPSQLSALFHGAHGSSQGGIHGDQSTGAYSIVISGKYEDLDQDRGDTVYYSGSGSHENTDPRNIPDTTAGTQALSVSLSQQRDVRVLRAAARRSRYAPSHGYRYDGLYRVVAALTPLNSLGGMYEQFKLVRVEGQTSLDECRRAPSGPQVRDYEKINDYF